jgi:hypothetical protein
MNFLGKLLMGFLVVCLLAAIYFTTGVLKARSTWLTKIETTSKQIVDAEEKLKSERKQFETVRDQVHQENLRWGKAWAAPNSGPAPVADGSVELGVGSNAGLGRGQQNPALLPIVHVFGKDAQNQPQYLGDFQLTDVRQNQAGGKLTRPPFTGEVENWPRGEYRVRELVPYDYTSTINSLRTLILLAEQNVEHEKAALAYQDEHLVASQAALDKRLNELNGDANAPDAAGPDVKDGLVQTMRREETARNDLVQKVDALRRELSDVYLKLTKTLQDNQSNSQKLGGSASTQLPPNRVAAQKAATTGN